MGDTKNKFDEAVAKLNEQEEFEKAKSQKVIHAIAGKGRKKEERKVLPTYIPIAMYEQFNAINNAYGISNNAAINMLVRDYITEKKDILNNI